MTLKEDDEDGAKTEEDEVVEEDDEDGEDEASFGSGAWLEVMSLKSSGHGGLEGELGERGGEQRLETSEKGSS
nr:hypothetical protein CFP56_49126 [Quercus suber]